MIFKEKYCTGVLGQKRGQNEFSVFYNKLTDFLHEVATAYRLKSFWQNLCLEVFDAKGTQDGPEIRLFKLHCEWNHDIFLILFGRSYTSIKAWYRLKQLFFFVGEGGGGVILFHVFEMKPS